MAMQYFLVIFSAFVKFRSFLPYIYLISSIFFRFFFGYIHFHVGLCYCRSGLLFNIFTVPKKLLI